MTLLSEFGDYTGAKSIENECAYLYLWDKSGTVVAVKDINANTESEWSYGSNDSNLLSNYIYLATKASTAHENFQKLSKTFKTNSYY